MLLQDWDSVSKPNDKLVVKRK